MTITTMDSVAAALASASRFQLYVPSGTNVAGGYINLSKISGNSFGKQANPTAYGSGGSFCYDTLAGFPTIGVADVGQTRYLGYMDYSATTVGSILVYDRVWACSGFSGIVTSAQTVSSFPSPIPRPDSFGTGLKIWVEWYTATGSTASNITCSYTNSAGVSGRSTVSTAIPTSMPANRMIKLPLAGGDTGVQSVQSITLSASTGTAGNFGITLMRPLAQISNPVANLSFTKDFAGLGLPIVNDHAAISFIQFGTTTSTGIQLANFSILEG